MDKLELQKKANDVRKGIVTAVHGAGAGHPGGSLSAADIFTYLYFEEMNIDPKDPKKKDRDRFVLSKGHTAPGLYSTLANRGYFPVEDLPTLRHLGSYLQGHPCMQETPGVDMSSGSLGQGISAAVGMALAAKLDNASYRTYTLLGDGELEEGQNWEAILFAGSKHVDNLIVTVDYNKKQIDGSTDAVMSLGNLRAKFEAFQWLVLDMNGNDMKSCVGTLKLAKTLAGHQRPVVILMKTEMGQGVDFMMGTHKWHGTPPDDEQAAAALAQLPETLGDY